MSEDRRSELRRLEDLRELLRFCRHYGQSVPSKVAARLRELGIEEPERRPIQELLADLEALERPALDALPADRRTRQRRWLSQDATQDEEE